MAGYNIVLLEKLQQLLRQKQSKAFYAEKLGVPIETIDELLQELREKESSPQDIDIEVVTKRVNIEKGTIESTRETTFDPKTVDELAKLHKIDTSQYKITNYWSKLKANGKFTSSVFATLIRVDDDLQRQKDILLEELRQQIPYIPLINRKKRGKLAYEINVPDIHFGKMAWREETGEDYDLKIAEKRYTTAIEELLSNIKPEEIEKIIFPIGNDMIHIDSKRNETFAGTPQDSDSRFFKIVKVVKNILIKTIDSLSVTAPVDIVVVSGNHDTETMFMIGEMLDAYYHNNTEVNIDNSPKQRKYYQYGLNGFQYSHGNEERHNELGLIFATEESKLWADTKFRFCKLGHFHKNKKTEYLSVDDHQGFQVQILPSLCGSDAWHKSKGYMSKKQAKGFLYDKEKGQIGEFTYSV